MEKILFIIIFMFPFVNATSQEYLIVKRSGVLHVLNYSTKKNTLYFDYYEYDEDIKLNTIGDSVFAGYNWKDDTLLIYLEKLGHVNIDKFQLKTVFPIPVNNVKFNVENVDSYYYYRHNNQTTSYHIDNIKININHIKMNIECYKSDKLFWKKEAVSHTGGITTAGLGYLYPIISPDKKSILVLRNKWYFLTFFESKLYEIDITTGKKKKICSKCREYSYSPGGRFILYRKKNKYCVYDRINNKTTEHYSWEKAFWLYK